MDSTSIAGSALQLTRYLEEGQRSLGPLVVRDDIHSSKGPFKALPEYCTSYPPVVIQALGELYQEYNRAFASLVERNREWETDYQYCFQPDGTPLNRWVQIDMVGLPDRFLEVAEGFTVAEVKEALRHFIFEIENSLAMYQLLMEIIADGPFKPVFLRSLEELRQQFGKRIALLAVTDAKYQALVSEELGCQPGDEVTDELVRERTGFDRLFGPDSFRQHVQANGGECDYLLFVRSSDPVDKLKEPDRSVEHPLLADAALRCIIKAYSLTFNIDDPVETNLTKRINDTKAYMAPMGMAHKVQSEEDIYSSACAAHMKRGKPVSEYQPDEINISRLHPDLVRYLRACGVEAEKIVSGDINLRAKPAGGTYGCYGHHVFNPVGKAKRRQNFRRDLRARGTYVLQPERATPYVVDPSTGVTYGYIDRNFMTVLADGTVTFMGGFRSLLPLVSAEAQKGRYHGNTETVWAGIS